MARDSFHSGSATQKVLLWVLRVATKLLLRVEITGLHNIPFGGPLIVIINHIAFLDPFLVLESFPGLVTPIAKREAFDLFIIGPLMKIYGAIPVHRGEMNIRSMKSALRVLQNGGIVLIAPEGTRSPTCQMQPGKEGAVMLALRTGATLVPVGVTGTQRAKAYWQRLKRVPAHLSVGKPFRLQRVSAKGRASRAEMIAMTREMMYRLAAQLPREFRGVYSNLEEATEIYLVPAEG